MTKIGRKAAQTGRKQATVTEKLLAIFFLLSNWIILFFIAINEKPNKLPSVVVTHSVEWIYTHKNQFIRQDYEFIESRNIFFCNRI